MGRDLERYDWFDLEVMAKEYAAKSQADEPRLIVSADR
jgi:hypothetical protein